MNLLLIGGLWLLNAVISTLNSFAVGHMFRRKDMSAWEKVVAWSGYIMAGSGFSWCILIAIALGAIYFGYLPVSSTELLLNLGYVLIVPGVLFSGYVITIHSVIQAYRNRSLGSTAVAGWNVMATGYNTVNAFRYLPQAFGSVLKAFTKGNGKNGLVLLLAGFALLSGFIISGVIVWRVSEGGK